jgi:hypothetical protein
MNTIPDNCSPINIHIRNNNIKQYDSNTIINIKGSRSSHQYDEVGTTPNTSSQSHRSVNNNIVIATDDGNLSRQYNEGITTTDNYTCNYKHNGNTNPVNDNIFAIDPVSGIRSTTFNVMGSRPTTSRHTHTNISTDNAANDKIIHRTNHQYNKMETIIDTGTYINNLSGHFHPGEHMRRITRTRALQSSPSTNARHLSDKDLVEVSDWSR